jgi:hypothetical protein
LSQQQLCHQFLHSNLNYFPCFSTWIPLENSKVVFKVEGLLPLLSLSLV